MTNTIIQDAKSINSENMVLQYLIREPVIKSEKNKAIILLHGVGNNDQDLFSLANQLPDDFLIISARGQFTLDAGRYAWFNVDFSTGKPIFDKNQEVLSRNVITKFIKQIKQHYSIDELYLGGISQGAIMSYSIGLLNPKEVKGIIAFSGRLLIEVRPFLTKNEDLEKLKVFIAHGIQDNTLPIHYARDAKEYLESLGVQLSYREYNMGHQISSEVLNDLNAWLEIF